MRFAECAELQGVTDRVFSQQSDKQNPPRTLELSLPLGIFSHRGWLSGSFHGPWREALQGSLCCILSLVADVDVNHPSIYHWTCLGSEHGAQWGACQWRAERVPGSTWLKVYLKNWPRYKCFFAIVLCL